MHTRYSVVLLVLFSLLSSRGGATTPTLVRVDAPGTLSKLLTEQQQDTCRHLIVSGKINSEDIKVLRKMAGADGRGQLCLLELADAEIASSKMPYLTITDAEERIEPRISRTIFSTLRLTDKGYTAGEMRFVNFILHNQAESSVEPFSQQHVPTWKKIVRQRLKAKGHTVTYEDGHYVYSAFTRKGLFCEDMFYACPNLRLVVLPQKGEAYDRVAVERDPIQYKVVQVSR